MQVLCEVLRLVRPLLNTLALGLGLVFSDVCILLTTRCLHAPLLYSEGHVVLRDHTKHFCETNNVLAGSSIVKMVESDPGGAISKTHLHVRKD